jgi:hypothetical protein
VAATEQRIAAKADETKALRDQLAAMAVRTFTGAGAPELNPLLANVSDATSGLQRDHLTHVALSTGTATTDQLDDHLPSSAPNVDNSPTASTTPSPPSPR